MKIKATSLSGRQRRAFLVTCVGIPDSLLRYMQEHSTNRVKEAAAIYESMVAGRIPFCPKTFHAAVQAVYDEQSFRGLHYGLPQPPRLRSAEFAETCRRIEF